MGSMGMGLRMAAFGRQSSATKDDQSECGLLYFCWLVGVRDEHINMKIQTSSVKSKERGLKKNKKRGMIFFILRRLAVYKLYS